MPRGTRSTPAAQERAGQTALIVDEAPRGIPSVINVADINPEPAVPEQPFVDNIQRLGVLQPVAVIRDRPNGTRWIIADGRRRVATARMLDMETVPALCFPPGTPTSVASAIALSANLQRAPNPVGEYRAIQQMVTQGFSLAQIREQLRLDNTTLTKRMKLGSLLPELLTALEEDRLKLTVAEKLASMPREQQEAILERMENGERITTALLNSLRTEATQEDMGVGGDGEGGSEGSPRARSVQVDEGWEGVMAALQAAEDAVPPNPDDATGRVLTAIATLRSQVERMARQSA